MVVPAADELPNSTSSIPTSHGSDVLSIPPRDSAALVCTASDGRRLTLDQPAKFSDVNP